MYILTCSILRNVAVVTELEMPPYNYVSQQGTIIHLEISILLTMTLLHDVIRYSGIIEPSAQIESTGTTWQVLRPWSLGSQSGMLLVTSWYIYKCSSL
jgi:hypothetical protein